MSQKNYRAVERERERTGKLSQLIPIAEPQQQEWQRKAPLFWIFRSPEAGRVKKLRYRILSVNSVIRRYVESSNKTNYTFINSAHIILNTVDKN